MNRSAIVARVAARMGLDKFTAEGAVDTVFEAIAEGLAKEEAVRIAGFGTFGTRSRAARTGRNPRTGESLPIPASKSPSFKAAKRLREAVTRGWQEEQEEPGDDRHGRPGSAGAMLEMSDWPGGVEPVWTVLEPESMEVLRAEPLADNPTLRLAADLPDETFAGSAFVRNALIVLELIGNAFLPRFTEKGHFGRDMVAAMREAMTWPGMEATEQYRAGKALREGDVWELHLLHRLMELAGLIEGRAFLGQLTPLGREMRELAESPEDYAPVMGVDADSGEALWEPWIGGFERGMRLRRAAWRQIARSDDREAATSLNLIIALSDSCRGRSDLTKEGEAELRAVAPEMIPEFVCNLHAWRKSRPDGEGNTGPAA